MKENKKVNGIELAARFSYITNHLRYCGPGNSDDAFLNYIKKNNPADGEKIRVAIKKFESLYPYLKLIADKSGKDFLDAEVVEAYWIGNKLLDAFNEKDMRGLVDELSKRGLPKTMAENLKKNMPKGAFPFHGLHVFYVGVGNVTGHVETTLQNMDNCYISVGRVVEKHAGNIVVMVKPLQAKKGITGLYFGEEEPKTVVYLPEILGEVNQGDYVALHWGFACMKLTEDQRKNLEKYNLKAMTIL